MYTMKEACRQTGLSYETLKFYCNEGLVPNVKRNPAGHRLFDDRDIAWINSLNCLRGCSMSLAEMKEYIGLCLEGEGSILRRKEILCSKRQELLARIGQLQESIAYIDWKQGFYDDVLSGKTPYISNLLPREEQG